MPEDVTPKSDPPLGDELDQKSFERKKRFYALESIRLKVLKEKAEVGVIWFKSIHQEILFLIASAGAVGGFFMRARTQHKASVAENRNEEGLEKIKSGEVSRLVDEKNGAAKQTSSPTSTMMQVETGVPGLKIQFEDSNTFWAGWSITMILMLLTAVNLLRKYIKKWRGDGQAN